MPKTVQIRDIDDDVYRALARRAAEAGVRVPAMLRRHAELLAARPTMKEWLERTRQHSSSITSEEHGVQSGAQAHFDLGALEHAGVAGVPGTS